jgi:hypothetical protein
MTDVALRCRCGAVTGTAHGVAPNVGNRVVCYCVSCRKFAEHIGAGERVLDQYGGTDIYQMPITQVAIDGGLDQIRCLRITRGGPYRWYAQCCNTPLGNSGSARLSFMGVIESFMETDGRRDVLLGPIRAHVNTRDVGDRLPAERRSGSMLTFIPRFLAQLLSWRLKGRHQANPFFRPD